MKYKVTNAGKSFNIPIVDFWVIGFDIKCFGLELISEDINGPNFVIEISTEFELTRYNQTKKLSGLDKDSIKMMVDLVGLSIKKAKCSKTGDLYITFEDGSELHVPDSEYEGWHVNVIVQERIKNSWVIGGVGGVAVFDLRN